MLFLRFGHFSRLHDVQMLAMLACVFQQHYNQSLENQAKQKRLEQHHSSPPSTPPTSHHAPFTSSLRAPGSRKVHDQQASHSPISSSWQNVQLDNGEPHFMEMEEQHDQQCRKGRACHTLSPPPPLLITRSLQHAYLGRGTTCTLCPCGVVCTSLSLSQIIGHCHVEAVQRVPPLLCRHPVLMATAESACRDPQVPSYPDLGHHQSADWLRQFVQVVRGQSSGAGLQDFSLLCFQLLHLQLISER